MKLVITTQSELDAIKLDFNGEIVITGGTIGTPIKLKEYYPDAEVILSGNAVVGLKIYRGGYNEDKRVGNKGKLY